MNSTVDMSRKTGAPNRFSCPLPTWEMLHELGRAFGWHPQGATYVIPAKSAVESPARRNYEPCDSEDQKQVGDADAMAWAGALEKAKVSPHVTAMLEKRSLAFATSGKADGELLPSVIDEFIEFAYGGAFKFAIRHEGTRGIDADSKR